MCTLMHVCLMLHSGDIMAYRKVCDAQGGPLVGEGLQCSGGLDLDWDLDKEELQEPGASMDRMQMQHVERQRPGRKHVSRVGRCMSQVTLPFTCFETHFLTVSRDWWFPISFRVIHYNAVSQ